MKADRAQAQQHCGGVLVLFVTMACISWSYAIHSITFLPPIHQFGRQHASECSTGSMFAVLNIIWPEMRMCWLWRSVQLPEGFLATCCQCKGCGADFSQSFSLLSHVDLPFESHAILKTHSPGTSADKHPARNCRVSSFSHSLRTCASSGWSPHSLFYS